MSSRRFSPPFSAAVSSGGGCWPGYLLPPLAVILVGGLLAVFMLGQANRIVNAQSASAVEIPPPAADQKLNTMDHSKLSPVFTPEVNHWSEEILRWASQAGLDPNMAATVMQIESCGDPQALSHAGAMGLFQVMPYHFSTEEDPFDPDTNGFRGLDYLRRSLDAAVDDPRLAFAGYNGGIGVIPRAESTWAGETIRYAYWGSGIYEEASSGAEISTRLQEWLQAGGASLCRQAAERLGIAP